MEALFKESQEKSWSNNTVSIFLIEYKRKNIEIWGSKWLVNGYKHISY